MEWVNFCFLLKNRRLLGAIKKVCHPHGLETVPFMMVKIPNKKLEGLRFASCEHHLLVTNLYSYILKNAQLCQNKGYLCITVFTVAM